MSEISRADHINWCKERALAYLDEGNVADALASMTSDLSKHDETRDHPALLLGGMLMLNGHLSTPAEVRRFVEGFN